MPELRPGDPAPEFDLQDGDGKEWSLRGLKGQKVILYFYPADDTPGCTVEATDFRDNIGFFQERGVVVLGVSPQDAESHRAFTDKCDLNFPLLVDEDLSAARAYGALGEERMFKDIPLIVNRSTFVIDEDGNIERALYGVNAQGHVSELKDALRA